MKNISPPVFYYHSVAPKMFDGWLLKFLTIKLANFEQQMAYLKEHHFQSIFMDEWLRIRRGVKTATGKEVCLTFDDGLLDNWVYAWPVAKKYGMKFTIFVSPECIEPRSVVRPTLEDVWTGKCKEEELDGLGYLSWDELKLMQESGVVDVQSHTMTHAKYISSPTLRGFYYGGFKGYHPILNAHPELRATYFHDADFEKKLPLGTPLFEETSAVVVKKHFINAEFFKETQALAQKSNLQNEAKRAEFEQSARAIADDYARRGKLLDGIEKDEDYRTRLGYEIVDSKRIIEEKLGGKPVHFLCWPHGDNNSATHALAKEAGYHATTSGKMLREQDKADRIPRIGADFSNGPWVNRQKFHYKVAAHYHKQPFYAVARLNDFKNKILQS
ncbi:MAG: polysaccharide deacetylase family protein [Saprospiraceae bacterium]